MDGRWGQGWHSPIVRTLMVLPCRRIALLLALLQADLEECGVWGVHLATAAGFWEACCYGTAGCHTLLSFRSAAWQGKWAGLGAGLGERCQAPSLSGF